jgi:hypothetical protein
MRRAIDAVLQHRRSVGHVVWISTLLLILRLTLLPSSQVLTSTRWCIICGDAGGVDAILNVLMFMPLGLGLAMAGVRRGRALALMVLLTLTIETLQLTLISGRDASLGDLMTNSVGGALGFSIGAGVAAWLRPNQREARRLALAWVGGWIAVQCIASYALMAAPTDARYYGQIKRSLNGRPPYAGDVLLATIDGVRIPNTLYERAGVPQPVLATHDGAIVRVDIVPRGPTRRTVPIVRVVDEDMREQLLVAQFGRNLIFGIRNGGIALRLRPTYAMLRDVFPPGFGDRSADTVRVEARYGARYIAVSATTGPSQRAIQIPASPLASWRFIYPARFPLDDGVHGVGLTLLWLFVLLAPLAYWAAHARDQRGVVTAVTVGVLLGFAGVPLVLGKALPGAIEWVGALLSLATGTIIGRSVSRP